MAGSGQASQSRQIFERIRGDLIRIVASRGCPVPEDLADEAIERVARKAPELAKITLETRLCTSMPWSATFIGSTFDVANQRLSTMKSRPPWRRMIRRRGILGASINASRR